MEPTHKPAASAAKKPDISFGEALKTFLGRLPLRSRQILEARFSMSKGKPTTLQEIGEIYQITRERVRQIIGAALSYLSAEKDPILKQIITRIEETLAAHSGIMTSDALLEKLAPGSPKEKGAVLAFLACSSNIREEAANKEHDKVYRLENRSMPSFRKVKDEAKAILLENKKVREEKEFFNLYHEKHPNLTAKEFFDLLSVSKEIEKNVFGKWGLASWGDIRPRGTRQKAHLILKTEGKPLHFREIATLIDQSGLQSKKGKSHPQTVHNELIKDKRFVLVGRGIYALKAWGYEPGTVKDVLEKIFTDAQRELSREEVLEEVMKVRQVKKSTVIINLNTFFARVGKNAYALKK